MPTTDIDKEQFSKEREEYLWKLLDRMPGGVEKDWVATLQQLKAQEEQLSFEDIYTLIHRTRSRADEWDLPLWLIRFIVRLLDSREVTSLLDPASNGLHTTLIAKYLQLQQVDIVCAHPFIQKTYESVAETYLPTLHSGAFEHVRSQLTERYDAIVCFPIFGQRPQSKTYNTEQEVFVVKAEPGLLHILDAATCLTPQGLMIFLVPPSFMFPRNEELRQTLPKMGLHLTALLHLRSGTFSNTGIPAELALIEPVERQGLYVAEIPENYQHQDQLLARLQARKPGATPVQGKIVNPEHFYGFESFEAEETTRQLARQRGLNAVPFEEAVLEICRPKRYRESFTPYEPHPDAVYLPEIDTVKATISPEKLSARIIGHTLQLIVNRKVVLPEYLAHLYNTPLGHQLRKAASTGGVVGRIHSHNLQRTLLYLPPRKDQIKAVEALQTIRKLREELEELEDRLQQHPRRSAEVLKAVQSVNHEERFLDWVETLPFPLATILRAYHTVDKTEKEKYGRLLQFFEAVVIFCSTVLLSAYLRTPQLWAGIRAKLQGALQRYEPPLSQTDFSFWRTLLGVLAVDVRINLNNPEKKPLCIEAFALLETQPLEIIASKKLSSILDTANEYRNRWPAHGGSPGRVDVEFRHNKALELLNEFRSLVGNMFLQYELVIFGQSTVLPGPIFRYEKTQCMMGSHFMVESPVIELTEAAITGHLYCYSPGYRRALQLLPLFQLVENPPLTCYFFNRLDKETDEDKNRDTPYFVSYHLSENTAIPSDISLNATKKALNDLSKTLDPDSNEVT
jgi:hypothetical protein